MGSVVLGMGSCKATILMRLNNLHRRYCFVYCLLTGISVHDFVIDYPHQLFHSGRPLFAACDPLGCPS